VTSVDQRAYLDTSALAKWYLNEAGSDAFVAFLQQLGCDQQPHGHRDALLAESPPADGRSFL
jgi:hypothetical protein